MVNHTWKFPKANFTGNPADKALYNFEPKLDNEIIASARNLKNTEELLNHTYGAEAVAATADSTPAATVATDAAVVA